MATDEPTPSDFDDDDELGPFFDSGLNLREGDMVPHTDYRLVERLGAGAYGEVWKAKHTETERIVALKFLTPPITADNLSSFRTEHKLLKRIHKRPEGPTKGFIRLYDVFRHDRENPFLVLEYVAGKTLRHVLRSHGAFSPIEAAEIVFMLARIVACIHLRKNDPIVHRDLKPENIFVLGDRPPSWRFKIGDLGIGRVSVGEAVATELGLTNADRRQGEGIGTRAYMSWEQTQRAFKEAPADDVHALGVMWYELLEGRYPFAWCGGPPSHRDDPAVWQVIRMHINELPLSEPQASFLESCLKRRESLPENAAELALRIDELFLAPRKQIQQDVREIERLRKSGGDWQAYFREIAEQRQPLWGLAIKNEVPEGLWLGSLSCRYGIFVESDSALAREGLEWAAGKLFPHAERDLALLYLEHERTNEREREHALCLLKRAAEGQHPAEALFRAGKILLERRAIDVLPFVESVELPDDYAQTFALNGACVEVPDDNPPYSVEASPKVRNDGLYSRAIPLRCQVTVTSDNPDDDVLPPCDRLPIYLLLSFDAHRLVYGPQDVDRPGHAPTLLQELMGETEDELLRSKEYFFSELRSKLKEIWLDPWATCQEKGLHYIQTAAKRGHAEAQMWLAEYHERAAQEEGVAQRPDVLGKTSTYYRLAADKEHWGGRWESQLALAQRLFAFFQKLVQMEGRNEQNVEFLRLAKTWCEKAQANSGREQEKWVKSKGEDLLDKIYRCCKDDGGAEQPTGSPG